MLRYHKIIPTFLVLPRLSLLSLTPSRFSNCYASPTKVHLPTASRSSSLSASASASAPVSAIKTEDIYDEYNYVEGVETLEHYVPGGYHPLMIGDIVHSRYRIVDKLGFGGFSTVWLAFDTHKQTYAAIKVGVADQGQSGHEIEILCRLSKAISHPGRSSIPVILDRFEVTGPNGTHQCYTTVPARCDLLNAAYGRIFSLDVVRALAARITQAVACMHAQGFVHADIHSQNILIKAPPNLNSLSIENTYKTYGDPYITPVERCDGKPLSSNVPSMAVSPKSIGRIKANKFTLADADILLSDFGETFSPAVNSRRARNSNIPLGLRPPEAKFEPDSPLTYSADIWSLGLLIWQILGLRSLFSNDFPRSDALISQYIDVLRPGPNGTDMPDSWWQQWDARDEFFDNDRKRRPSMDIWPSLKDSFDDVQYWRDQDKMGLFEDDERRMILELIRSMLKFVPSERVTIEQVLKSEWMVKWALPAALRSS